ncbi:hypothetical protein HB779_12370 [Phyllobacterium sp. 628]|uniref:hypothetical protein n=1 Tax=Phyllobacterium sp. 628 TaxID=2718938 RepID=UPI00166238B5|nr:hypothetical protein [Phyllobacterium sp. 628]QND52612.1 hypothetical protein HB779_12370 [Phyllobacterium sp. 628]
MTHLRLYAFAFMALFFYSLGIGNSLAASPAGRFCGEVISNGDYQDIETILNVGRDGHVFGTYQIDAADGLVMGTLTENEIETGPERTMIWTDKYGSGLLTVHFAQDFLSFNGRWGHSTGGAHDAPSHSWNGSRCYGLNSKIERDDDIHD